MKRIAAALAFCGMIALAACGQGTPEPGAGAAGTVEQPESGETVSPNTGTLSGGMAGQTAPYGSGAAAPSEVQANPAPSSAGGDVEQPSR